MSRLPALSAGLAGLALFALLGEKWWGVAWACASIYAAFKVGPPALDPARFFSDDDREEIRVRAGGRCQWPGCGAIVHYEADCPLGGCDLDYQADHVVAHANGGRTELANGQCLCRGHNLSKSDS